MSRPCFLADHDLNEHIDTGALRHEPMMEFSRVRDLGMSEWSDAAILEFSERESALVVSHDVNTMPAAAYFRLTQGLSFPGLFLVRQTSPIGPIIESLLTIWAASELEEWRNLVVFLPLG
jgi:hypothetical protein